MRSVASAMPWSIVAEQTMNKDLTDRIVAAYLSMACSVFVRPSPPKEHHEHHHHHHRAPRDRRARRRSRRAGAGGRAGERTARHRRRSQAQHRRDRRRGRQLHHPGLAASSRRAWPRRSPGTGPYTVFAPTDAAFKKVPKKTLKALGKDKAKLKAVLLYHVASGRLAAKRVVKRSSIKTLNGKRVQDPRPRPQRVRERVEGRHR